MVCTDGSSWFATALMDQCSNDTQSQVVLDGFWRHIHIINSMTVCGTRYLPKKNKRSPCSSEYNYQYINQSNEHKLIFIDFGTGASRLWEAPVCPTHRCALGQCLEEQDVCNGVPNCRDWSDESPNCSKIICDGHNCSQLPYLLLSLCY